MGQLEERFFSNTKETLITAEDSCARELCEVLEKWIVKGEFILRWGKSSKHIFNFDRIYDRKL